MELGLTPRPAPLERGAMLDVLEIRRHLGGGEWGHVYEALHTGLRRVEAVKIMHRPATSLDEAVLREALPLERLRRLIPPIAPDIFDVRVIQGVAVIRMQKIEGQSLLAHIEGPNLFAPPGAVAIARDLVGAVARCHREGLAHGDLHPGNVMIGHNGSVLLLDLGLARLDAVDHAANENASDADDGAAKGISLGLAPMDLPAAQHADVKRLSYLIEAIVQRTRWCSHRGQRDAMLRAARGFRTEGGLKRAGDALRRLERELARSQTRRRTSTVGVVLAACGVLVFAREVEQRVRPVIPEPRAEAVEWLRCFHVLEAAPDDPPDGVAAPGQRTVPFLTEADPTSFVSERGTIRAVPSSAARDAGAGVVARLDTAFGRVARDGVVVLDQRSGMKVRVTSPGAGNLPTRVTDRYVVQEQFAQNGAIVHAIGLEALHEHVALESPIPGPGELVLTLELEAGVAGLRTASNAVELLDAGGAPRLRIAGALLVDAAAQRASATAVLLAGCNADSGSAPPWGRVVVPPGRHTCEVAIRWDSTGLTAPFALKWSWQTTGSPSVKRERASVTALSGARALVTGGLDVLAQGTAEIFDAPTHTWAMAWPMNHGRYAHVATRLLDGRVLVIGGSSETVEVFDPTTAMFRETGALACRRVDASATTLVDGRVLVVGGACQGAKDRCDVDPSTTAQLYSLATGLWRETGAPMFPRKGHSASLLPDGAVLVAGSQIAGAPQKTAEVFDPGLEMWRLAGEISPRYDHVAITLEDRRVLLVGGRADEGSTTKPLATTEIFDPMTYTWAPGPAMHHPRIYPVVGRLPRDRIVVADGMSRADTSLDGTVEVLGSDLAEWLLVRRRTAAGRHARSFATLDIGSLLLVEPAPTDVIDPLDPLLAPGWSPADAGPCFDPRYAVVESECPRSSPIPAAAQSSGEVMRACARIDAATGDVDIELRKYDGSRFGAGDYVVRTAPVDGTACERGKTLPPIDSILIVEDDAMRGRFKPDWTLGPSRRAYCVTKAVCPTEAEFDPGNEAQRAWWFSGRIVVERTCGDGDEHCPFGSCSPP